MRKIIFVLVSIMVGITFAVVITAVAINDPSPPAKPAKTIGTVSVYQEIQSETDCNVLQKRFDRTETRHATDVKRNRLDLAEVGRAYMTAIAERMTVLGCDEGK